MTLARSRPRAATTPLLGEVEQPDPPQTPSESPAPELPQPAEPPAPVDPGEAPTPIDPAPGPQVPEPAEPEVEPPAGVAGSGSGLVRSAAG